MNCPVCDNVRMREVDKDSVTIDICPQCKGVWLDRGELDKLLEGVNEIRDDFNRWQEQQYGRQDDRGEYEHPSKSSYPPQQSRQQYPTHHPQQTQYSKNKHYHGKHDDPYYYKKKKKKNFLDRIGDVFDF